MNTIELKPLASPEYLWQLTRLYKHNTVTKEQTLEAYAKRTRHAFEVWYNDIRCAVILFSYIEKFKLWSFDAYRDDLLVKSLFNEEANLRTFQAARKALDWFENENISTEIYTAHRDINRAASMMVLRLGFKRIGERDVNGMKFRIFRKIFLDTK